MLSANIVAQVIVTDLVPLREVDKYLVIAGLVWAIADVAGPFLGGAFLQRADIFSYHCKLLKLTRIGMPPGAGCFTSTSAFHPLAYASRLWSKTNYTAKIRDFDYLGMLALCGGAVYLLHALSWGGNNFPWNDSKVVGCFVGGLP